jgi:hypothetical protein
MTETNEATSNETTTESAETRIFATLEEAKAGKPADKPNWKLFVVTDPAGKVAYAWSGSPDTAMVRVARSTGWKVSRADGANKEKVAGLLTKLSPEDRAALISQYAPAPAATEKPAGRKSRQQ